MLLLGAAPVGLSLLFWGDNVSASECYIEIYVPYTFRCQGNGPVTCSANLTPNSNLSSTYGDCPSRATLHTRLSSNWRSNQTFYLGYANSGDYTLHDRRTYTNDFRFTISKSRFKDGARHWVDGGYEYWEQTINVDAYAYWLGNDEWEMFPSSGTSSINYRIMEPAERTLTMKFIDTDGNTIAADKSVTQTRGTSASLTTRTIAGYSKIKWGTSTRSSTWTNNTSTTYTVNPLNDDTTIYAVYEKNLYQGNSQASGAGSGWSEKTGWKSSNDATNTVTYYINNCDPVNGCTGKLRHLLKQKTGTGSTQYKITRTSNYGSVSSETVVTTTTERFNESDIVTDGAGRKYRTVKVETFTDRIYPGQVVCETLKFKPDNLIGTAITKGSTTACVAALGNAQPDDTADKAFIDIKVRNDNVDTYNTLQKKVYAKPNDNLTYQASYNPVLQYTASLIPQKFRIGSGSIYPSGNAVNAVNTLAQLFNNRYSGANWNNAFSVASTNFITNNTYNYCRNSSCSNSDKSLYNIGNTSQKIESNSHSVLPSEVGRDLQETAQTNLNGTTQTTPSQVSFTKSSGNNLASVDISPKSSVANAYVPYNFNNTTELISNDSNTVLYAGEAKNIEYTYSIHPKYNPITTNPGDASQEYATTVANPQWKLKLCVGEASCNANNYSEETTVKMPASEADRANDFNINDMYVGRVGENAVRRSTTINIPDVPAGTQICIKSSVYPATSGADTNWNNPDGDGKWVDSAPACFVTAKRPSIQVWGGNIYSRGSIETSTSKKGNVAGYNNYGIENNNSKLYFGSWGELGIIANDTVKEFSSGASLGYSSNTAGVLSPNPLNEVDNNAPLAPNPGGSVLGSICDRSPLTFANSPCYFSAVGSIGNSITTSQIANDKASILGKYAYGGEPNLPDYRNVVLGTVTPHSDNVYYYYGGNNSLTLGTGSAEPGTTHIVHSASDITIVGDLTYGGTYTNLENTPKIVIYGRNITIDCNVAKIDALLIADNDVVTCDNFEHDYNNAINKSQAHVNDEANSHQLIINGAIIANRLIPNRTYGAATGGNSMVPAEIINFDPTLYLWGNNKSDDSTDSSTNLDTSIIKELAPRW